MKSDTSERGIETIIVMSLVDEAGYLPHRAKTFGIGAGSSLIFPRLGRVRLNTARSSVS